MDILLNDVIQYSDAPETLKSPMLADTAFGSTWTITLDASRTVECIGIGNTDATTISVNGEVIALTETGVYKNGLYNLTTPVTGDTLTIEINGTYLGRIGAGLSRTICTKRMREPGFYSTASNRTTRSGQVIPGAGGITGRTQQVDTRYRFTSEMFADVQEAYPTQFGRGFPLFVSFEQEKSIGWIEWSRFYGQLKGDAFVLQASTASPLYSKKFNFTERF